MPAGSYHLEIATPGVHRPLKSKRDFERNIGRTVHVFLKQHEHGHLEWQGKLERVYDGHIGLRVDGDPREFLFDHVNYGKLVVDPHFAAKPKKVKKTKGTSGRLHRQ